MIQISIKKFQDLRSIPAVLSFLILSLGLFNSGCGALISRASLHPDFLASDAAVVAGEAVRAKFGDDVRVLEVDVNDDEFEVKVQDASNPENVDLYKYRGGFLIKNAAVRLDGLERNLKNTVFNFAEIDFAAIPRLEKAIRERAQLENARITKIEIKRKLNLSGDFENSGDVRWYIEFAGEREQISATADAKGNLLGVDLSNTRQARDFNLYDPQELKRAAETVRASFDAKSPILEITLRDKSLTIEKPDAGDLQLIRTYTYDVNGLKKGYASTSKSEIDRYFSLDEINIEDALRLSRLALEKLDAPQGYVSYASVKKVYRMADDAYTTIWNVNVQTMQGMTGKSGFVEFDATGNVRNVVKWK